MRLRRLEELLARISRVRLAVVGDYFLDRYGRGEVRGTSRETGRPVIRIWGHTFCPGGTGNVAANAAALGAKVLAVGVLGEDPYADIYRTELLARGIDASHLHTDPRRITPSFEKFLVGRRSGRMREFRIDVDNQHSVSGEVVERLCRSIDGLADEVDALLVADYEEYGQGILTAEVRERLRRIGASGRLPTLVMSRTRVGQFLPLIPVQNEYEVVTQTGVARPGIFDDLPDEMVERGARTLLAWGAPMVFVTRGRRGISVFLGGGAHTLVSSRSAPGPVDTVGAGDTVMAAVGAALAAGAEPTEAALLGNCAAFVTVRKLGITGTASPDEVREAFKWISSGESE